LVKYNPFVTFPCPVLTFFLVPTPSSKRPIFALYGSNDVVQSKNGPFLVRTMSDIIWGNVPQPLPPKKGGGAKIRILKSNWYNIKTHISAAVWAISTKFGTVTQFVPLDSCDRLKFQISKIQDGGGRHIEKSKNHHISAAVQPTSTKFGTLMQFDLPDRSDR